MLGPGLGDGAMAQQVCVVLSAAEREQLSALVADRKRPRKHVERRASCSPRRSAPGAAGGAQHRPQPADSVAVATALRCERGRGFAARPDPQARQAADRGGNHGAGGSPDVHRAAAPGDPLDRPGNGQSHRHLAGLGAAHLAGAQIAAAPAAHLQTLARSQFRRQADRHLGLYIDPPAHAVVLSIDEKSQIEAPDRTVPGMLEAIWFESRCHS